MPELKKFLEEKENVKRLARILYHAIPVKDAVQLSKRVDYFRGRKLTESFADGKLDKKLSFLNVKTEKESILIGAALLKHGFIHASKVKNKERRELEPLRTALFENDGYYTWLFQASSFKKNFLLGLIICGFLSLVMFPVWPKPMKTGIWYISVSLMILFFALIVIRGILFTLIWIFGYEFWLFPNLFDDDASFFESFQPLFSSEKSSTSFEAWISRFVVFLALVGSGLYLYSQPTEFDEILVIQRQFVSDLYEGKLLSNEEEYVEQELRERERPDLDTLRKELDDEEEENDNLIDSLLEEDEENDDLNNFKEEL